MKQRGDSDNTDPESTAPVEAAQKMGRQISALREVLSAEGASE